MIPPKGSVTPQTRITYSYKEYGPNDKEDDYPTGNTCILVTYPVTILSITVKFFDLQAIQQPNADIYYQVDISFTPVGTEPIKAVMKVDEQYNYIPYPGGLISYACGHNSCKHEKYELSDEHHEEVKNAIKCFLTKIRETTT
jgi:hypothetical protein